MTWFDGLSPNMKAAIFTAVIGAIGGGGTWIYNIGYNNGARDIADVQAFKGKLPTMIDDLDKVSKSLAATTQLIDDNKRLAKVAADATDENKRLQEAFKTQAADSAEKAARLKDLTAQIAKAFPSDEIKVSIAEGSAERVVPNLLTIGVRANYGSSTDVMINGKSTSFSVADPKAFEVGDRTCTVLLMKVGNPASFIVTCSNR
ncbi:hypothetical protein [Bradyrhizobium sp. STM 3809]|uniref:hypothetical protein n=1 Tax=Bradyrhizobium sp. STM 3809 TaxID=551936 RepID=UPI000240A3AD|nr:hypothetical protein [Bradyrhizobium sp. STM 3809]CCE03933.1 hypothetical protein BRAS3809_900002 [Bradyrhizobium sp. STM 3809]